MRSGVLILVFVLQLLSWRPCEVHAKPALDEENRNLCEGEENLAECLREVEEAKARPTVTADENEKEEDSAVAKHEAMIQQVIRESEENRKYWKEEVRSMNKWDRYGYTT